MKYLRFIFVIFLILTPLCFRDFRNFAFFPRDNLLFFSLESNFEDSRIQVIRESYGGKRIQISRTELGKWPIRGQLNKNLVIKAPKDISINTVFFEKGKLRIPIALESKSWIKSKLDNQDYYRATPFFQFKLALLQFLPVGESFIRFLYLGILSVLFIGLSIVWLVGKTKPRSNRFHLICIFSFATVFLCFSAGIGIDYLHQGVMLHAAYDVSRGLVLFKETFTQYGALTTILQALAVEISGVKILSINTQTAIFYVFTGIGLWLTWRKILPSVLTSIVVLSWLFLTPFLLLGYVFHPWSSVYALCFQV